MFHSVFVLICPKVGDSVSFRVPSETVTFFPFPTRAIRVGSGARQINGYCMPTQLFSIQEDPFYGVQVPSFLSFKQTEM